MCYRIKIAIILFSIYQSGLASGLDNDKKPLSVLHADTLTIDLKTGMRTFQGNVLVKQGSMQLNCDNLVIYINNSTLNQAICTGNPGRFKQRLEGEEDDIIGQAINIQVDGLNQNISLMNQAKIVQGLNELRGEYIQYNLVTEIVEVKENRFKSSPSSEMIRSNLKIHPRKKNNK